MIHTSTDIRVQLRAQCEDYKSFHRDKLMKLLSCIQYLSRQGLALRGHNKCADVLDGNLHQWLILLSQNNISMKQWLSRREYFSPNTMNELIILMGQSVLRSILAKVKVAMSYATIADEATDVSHNEVMCISV